MLLLVIADGNMRRFVKQDVGRHQRGIGEQAQRDVLGILARRLVLVLRHALHPAHARHAVEHPGELGVLRHARLVEDDVLVGIDAGRDIGGGHFARRAPQFVRLLPDGDGVHVDHAIEALMRLLHFDIALDGAEVIAQM
jgi:hypothetical protein